MMETANQEKRHFREQWTEDWLISRTYEEPKRTKEVKKHRQKMS